MPPKTESNFYEDERPAFPQVRSDKNPLEIGMILLGNSLIRSLAKSLARSIAHRTEKYFRPILKVS